MQGATPKEVLDYEEALVNVGGSQELLGELAHCIEARTAAIDGGDTKGTGRR